MCGGQIDPAETAPFRTAPAQWGPWALPAATLSGKPRLDHSPGVAFAWVVLTGVARDGTRHLLSPVNGAQLFSSGTALDWFQAFLAGH